MVRVGVVWVVHCWVVAIVLRGSSGDADIRFTDISGTRRLKLASVILLRGPAGAVVVIVALIATYHQGISRRLGKRDLPLVAHLRGLGVTQDFRAFQGAVGRKACGGGAGDVIHVLAGRRNINGKFGTAGHRLRCLGASSTHDGAGLSVVEVVVVGGGLGGIAQVTVVDAGGRHGVTVRGVGGPTGARGVRRSVDILHLKGPLQSCKRQKQHARHRVSSLLKLSLSDKLNGSRVEEQSGNSQVNTRHTESMLTQNKLMFLF